jgi:hypothetical protein
MIEMYKEIGGATHYAIASHQDKLTLSTLPSSNENLIGLSLLSLSNYKETINVPISYPYV